MRSSSLQPSPSSFRSSSQAPRIHTLLLFLVHIFCLAVYLVPIFRYDPPTPKHGGPVLDELHIMSDQNRDVNDIHNSPWTDAFRNDYWGRPMNSESSHKSWRPLSVLSFRWLQFEFSRITKLNGHRLVNVVTHAAAAECVSILAVQLFPVATATQQLMTRAVSKIVFALHPTHVEVTANAANRPHILAVLCTCVLCDGHVNFLLFAMLVVCGFLTSETFIFQLPAIVLTMTIIRLTNQMGNTNTSLQRRLRTAMSSLVVRYLVLVALAVLYMSGRYYYDTLSIPDGLIRPAENPFYDLEGWNRVRNYAYVVAVHVCKSFFVDIVGFSHEYGFECIPVLQDWTDVRLLLPVGFIVILVVAVVAAWRNRTNDSPDEVPYRYLLLLLWHLSFCATLFPISGVVKVGTFVADRIVVASTVSVSILVGAGWTRWMAGNNHKTNVSLARRYTSVVSLVMFVLFLWRRVHVRTLQWMDSEELLQSSLRTCPRSAKSHLEVSKIYSGLYPEKLNLSKSLVHLQQAESIDPDYCDVHQQFAHVYIQQQRYREFEDRLYQGILCPFSMSGSVEMWRRYWEAVVKMDPSAKARMDGYNRRIQQRVEEEQRKLEMGQGNKHWAPDRDRNDNEL